MRRMFWVAVGAAGGIYAYKRGQQFAEESRERGVVLTVQQVAMNAASTVESARAMVESRLNQQRKFDDEGA
ncbi:MAG: hypothetical protein WCK04_05960 [Actinomycetes bacterium]